MPLTLYRRGGVWWARGSLRGVPIRRSLGTRLQEVAYTRARDLESAATGGFVPATLAAVRDGFLAHLAGETQRRYRRLLAQLEAHAGSRSYFHEITLAHLEAFLASRRCHPNTLRRDIQALRTVWAWAVDHELVRSNIAKKLRLPPEIPSETQPFSREEIARMAQAIEAVRAGDRYRQRLRAQFLCLLYTGLRRGDIALLRRSHVRDGRLLLRTSKKGTTVTMALNRALLRALADLPHESDYFFASGGGRRVTAASNLARSFYRVMARAGVRGHLHRFRDTFAVELLAQGADIRLVSKLLGHTSIRTTEKHYAPWVAAFQRQADAAVATLRFPTVPISRTASRRIVSKRSRIS